MVGQSLRFGWFAVFDSSRLDNLEYLIGVTRELSSVKSLDALQELIRKAARKVTQCDGATLVLKDGDQCYYADEDAISPLWKGQRFPAQSCISGWVIEHKQAAVIEDIYCDDRVPYAAYRPTFVRSLAMVPIRQNDPIGAIGNYWAEAHKPTEHEVMLLQALADTVAIAMENIELLNEVAHLRQQLNGTT
nr:GAF domain-containing protein [Simiduia aestuariiviva]